MSQESATFRRTETEREVDRRDDLPAREEAPTGRIQMVLGPLPNWILDEYCGKCAGLVVVKHFSAMAVDGMNPLIYDGNRFERITVFGARKRWWAVLS